MLCTKSLAVTKLHCVRHRQVDFLCSKINYEYNYFDNISSPAVMGLPENRLVSLCTGLES